MPESPTLFEQSGPLRLSELGAGPVEGHLMVRPDDMQAWVALHDIWPSAG